jgi:hypothetical protein
MRCSGSLDQELHGTERREGQFLFVCALWFNGGQLLKRPLTSFANFGTFGITCNWPEIPWPVLDSTTRAGEIAVFIGIERGNYS